MSKSTWITFLLIVALAPVTSVSASGKPETGPKKPQSQSPTKVGEKVTEKAKVEAAPENKAGANKAPNAPREGKDNSKNPKASDDSTLSSNAIESKNEKLNPKGLSSEKVNSRAEKVRDVRSRTLPQCRATTPAGLARVNEDPCSDFIIVFQPGFKRESSRELLRSSSAQVKREFSAIFNGALITGPLSKMIALSNNPNVLVIEDDLEVQTTALQSGAPWGLDRIDQRALPLSTSFDDADLMGANTYSFVVDTGIDATNQDFEGRVAAGFSAINDGRGSNDCNGHGTHVAGTIGGKNFGVAKRTTLIPVRVLDCNGSGSYSSVISGLDWIAANHRAGDAAVVNLSLGGPASSTLDGAVRNLIGKGISVIVAAGNSNADACNYSPARVPDAITVGASERNDARASFSNFGGCLDAFAPGAAITSTWLGSTGVSTISGTSMAAPHVAGVVARFIAQNPGLSPQLVAQSLRNSSTLNVIQNAGTLSPNLLLFLEVTAESVLTTPVDPTPTFKKVRPRGKK